ncbi:tryptophan 2,3-dioxygenase family protein [Streptomyces sp. NPDC089799]|uniref:tryptophan 2,3-dioxygenase family protein n=1 Tax=Streptomyces sp. NPDC089799 TaxID=3155066 RepID=UPI00343FCFF1
MTGELKYQNYLELDTLLSLQKPRAAASPGLKSAVLSEQFFIIAHQASELWLRQIIADLEAAIDAFTTSDDTSQAEWVVDLLQRAGELVRVLHTQLTALDRLPLGDFAVFRQLLGTASGAQSEQFRRLARLIGNAEQDGPLYESFAAWVARSGHTVSDIARRGIGADVYYRIIEALLDIGNGYWRWQVSHISLITRIMGNHAGTGGTSGADHLVNHCTLPFAELRELRSKAHIGLSVAST